MTEQGEPTYKHFTDQKKRKELFQVTRRLTRYLHGNAVTNLVLLDRSARKAGAAVIEYWRNAYPDEPRPNIYFVDPHSFTAIQAEGEEKEFDQSFEQTYANLLQDKDTPTLIFDNCIHGGGSIKKTAGKLEGYGLKNIKIGVGYSEYRMFSVPDEEDLTIDFEAGKDLSCYPFGAISYVSRRPCTTSPNTITQEKIRYFAEIGMEERQEVKKIVKEFMKTKEKSPRQK